MSLLFGVMGWSHPRQNWHESSSTRNIKEKLRLNCVYPGLTINCNVYLLNKGVKSLTRQVEQHAWSQVVFQKNMWHPTSGIIWGRPVGHTSECRREKRQRVLFAAVAKAINCCGSWAKGLINYEYSPFLFPYTPESRPENFFVYQNFDKNLTLV